MELRLLEYFLTIAAAGSISQAAERLHITQPTLSRQLKGLETELGAPLFTRTNHGLTLTAAGLFLKTRAQEILTLTAQTEQSFIDQRQDLFSGQINIGAVEADSSHMLAQEIAAFTKRYPAVTFNLFTDTSDRLFDRLDKGLIDVALLLEPIDATKYAHLTLADLTIVGHFNLIFNILPLVQQGIGAALTIEGVIDPKNHAGVRFVPFSPRVQTHTVLAWRKHRLQTPITTAFIDAFRPHVL